MSNAVNDAAEALYGARRDKAEIPRVSETFGIDSVEDAYAVQQANVDRDLSAGRRTVGRKIGLTSKAVQQQLGVDQPDFGTLWGDYAFDEGSSIPRSKFIQPKVEAEIAFVLGRKIDDPEADLVTVMSAIEYALPAVEIVDSAITKWSITLVDTIADNASGGGFCLGNSPRKIEALDLRLAGSVLSRNGVIASTGVGAACLGNPLIAAAWLARKMASLGTPLNEGDIVLSGALGPMVPADEGDVFNVDIAGFSSLNFAFGKAVT